MFESLTKSSLSAAKALRVRSALNPMLWLTAIGTPLCFGAALLFRENPAIALTLVLAGLLPIVVTCLGFAYFARRKPEKLQSEEYQLRHESLQLIQAKVGYVVLDPTSLAAIANPALPALPSAGESEK